MSLIQLARTRRQLAHAMTAAMLMSCTTYIDPRDPCRPHDVIPTLQIPLPYSDSNGETAPSCNIDDNGVVTIEYTPLSCSATIGWWAGCSIAANQDLREFDATTMPRPGGHGVLAIKLCVKDFVPSALNLRYGSPDFAANGRTKFMPMITTGERLTESGCRVVYLSPQDACYGFNRCGTTSGCVTDSTTDPGTRCDTFGRSQLIVMNEFCVASQPAATKPTVVTIEKITYYPEQCICTDTSSCTLPKVCRHDGWRSDSRCDDAAGGCPGVCAP